MEYKDYYKILGVEKKADAKAVKDAYRRLVRKYHPDVNKNDPRATERFKEINEAYEVLSDTEKRKRYDHLGPDWQRFAQSGFRPGAGQEMGGFRVHFTEGDLGNLGDFSDFFRTIFGDMGIRSGVSGRAGGRGRGRGGDLFEEFAGRGDGAQRGEDLETPVEISLEEAYTGTKRIIELGTEQGHHRLEVKIPPGIRNGAKVRVAGEGSGGQDRGPKGDLYLMVEIRSHPLFVRKEDDLYVDVPISVVEAALGAEIEVPTLRGKVSMKIPYETSSGKTFRLTGYGMPHVRGGGSGDQFVKVRVVLPSRLSEAERKLFEELKQLRRDNPRAHLGLR